MASAVTPPTIYKGSDIHMAEYSTAATSAESALETAMSQGVEEYSKGDMRVKLGSPTGKAKDLAFLEGMAARRSGGGMFRVGRMVNPSK